MQRVWIPVGVRVRVRGYSADAVKIRGAIEIRDTTRSIGVRTFVSIGLQI